MRTLILFFVLCFYIQGYAQNYMPMLKEGRVWNCVIVHFGTNDVKERSYTITVGDKAVVKGQEVKTLHFKFEHLDGIYDINDYDIYAYEADRKLYGFFEDSGEWSALPMLDFS